MLFYIVAARTFPTSEHPQAIVSRDIGRGSTLLPQTSTGIGGSGEVLGSNA